MSGFIWLEFWDVVRAGRVFRLCDQCGDMFVPAPGAKRTAQSFCQLPCTSNAYHNNKEGIALKAERAAWWQIWGPNGIEAKRRREELQLASGRPKAP